MDSKTDSEQQPVPFRTSLLKTTSSDGVVEPAVPLLPATYRKDYRIEPVQADIHAFLNVELNVQRLNQVHEWLWLAGLPSAPRPLHYQIVKKREIVVTEQLDLHFVWSSSKSSSILIKPLSRFLFCPVFWQTEICPHQHLYETALGFLLSYVALIEREVDYNLAINNGLFPKEITWSGWLALANEISSSLPQAPQLDEAVLSRMEASRGCKRVNKRFNYGELRLGRLNWIYRLTILRRVSWVPQRLHHVWIVHARQPQQPHYVVCVHDNRPLGHAGRALDKAP
ncbi:hypothetical protein ACJQWK_06338 [Exserohilum turcicum]